MSPLGRPPDSIGSTTLSPTAPLCALGLVTDRLDTFQVKLWLASPPWPSLAVTETEYAFAEPVIVPPIWPELVLIDRPDGKPVAAYVHESPMGRPRTQSAALCYRQPRRFASLDYSPTAWTRSR